MKSPFFRRLNYAQPINWANSLNHETIFWIRALPKEAGAGTLRNLVEQKTVGTLTAGTWGMGPTGDIAPDFNGTTTSLVINYTPYATGPRSWAIWAYLRTLGEGSAGRLWDHSNESLTINTTTLLFGHNFTTSGGSWTTSLPNTNVWLHYLVTYDSSSTSNVPLLYINGINTTLTLNAAPVGTAIITGTPSHYMGSRSSGSNTCDGLVDDFHVWDRLLNPSEAYPLYQESLQPYSDLLNWIPAPKVFLAGGSNSQRGAIMNQQQTGGGYVGVQHV